MSTLTAPAQAPKAEEASYSQSLRSTAWAGGSTAVNILIGIVRTKAMAVLLGPAGFGLAGLYLSILNVAQSVAGMGVSSSGVRQIAEAAGTGDRDRIARTATVLRRTSAGLGALGALALLVFATPVAEFTFSGTGQAEAEAGNIRLLAAAVALYIVTGSQTALLQGLRHIAAMAKAGALAALAGAALTIGLLYGFGERGVVPSLVGVAGAGLLVNAWYSRGIRIEGPPMGWKEMGAETAALLRLGFAFMISSLLMMASAYAIRILVLHRAGLEATGLYQSAWTIGGLYVGMILQAMGADFYPRLTAAASGAAAASANDRCNRLVNEQMEVSLLLAAPGVIGTLGAAPLVLNLLYGTRFEPALDVLRWICLGVAMRVISWPMGFLLMAKSRQGLIIGCELAWTAVHLGLALVLVDRFGLAGAGGAFFGSYVFHIGLTYAVARGLTGFRWSAANRRLVALYLAVTGAVFGAAAVLPRAWMYAFAAAAASAAAFASLRALSRLVSFDAAPAPLRALLGRRTAAGA